VNSPCKVGHVLERVSNEAESIIDLATFLPLWLFFGLLAEMLEQPVGVDDYDMPPKEDTTQRTLCTTRIRALLGHYTTAEKQRRSILLSKAGDDLRNIEQGPHCQAMVSRLQRLHFQFVLWSMFWRITPGFPIICVVMRAFILWCRIGSVRASGVPPTFSVLSTGRLTSWDITYRVYAFQHARVSLMIYVQIHIATQAIQRFQDDIQACIPRTAAVDVPLLVSTEPESCRPSWTMVYL
jgi:hypothetical protein